MDLGNNLYPARIIFLNADPILVLPSYLKPSNRLASFLGKQLKSPVPSKAAPRAWAPHSPWHLWVTHTSHTGCASAFTLALVGFTQTHTSLHRPAPARSSCCARLTTYNSCSQQPISPSNRFLRKFSWPFASGTFVSLDNTPRFCRPTPVFRTLINVQRPPLALDSVTSALSTLSARSRDPAGVVQR